MTPLDTALTVTPGQLALYAGALFVLFLTPGPVWLATAARTLAHGMPGAIPLVLGVAVGDMIWSLAALLGLAFVTQSYVWVLTALKWVAVLVFAGMGWLLIRNASRTISPDHSLTRPGLLAGFAAGLIAVTANPKAALFYIGLLPGFFDLSAITVWDVVAIAAISMIVPMAGNTLFVAFVDRARRLIASPGALTRTNRVAGGLLILVAVVIAVTTP